MMHAINGVLYFIKTYPAFGPIFGALIAAGAGVWAAYRFTGRVKQIDATLEFSKRYQELMQQRRDLNRNYETTLNPTSQHRKNAETWWWRYFDLILYEYDFYRHNLVHRERFTEWMTWRWREWSDNERARAMVICGMNYHEGWAMWQTLNVLEHNPFISFLDSVHQAVSEAKVQEIVARCKRVHDQMMAWPGAATMRFDMEDERPRGLITLASRFPARETADRLASGLAAKNMTLFARIDHARGTADVGMALRPTELLIFGNARGGTPLMQADQAIGIDLPLKALVYEDGAGKVWLAYNDPHWLARRHRLGASAAVESMTAALASLAATATRPPQ